MSPLPSTAAKWRSRVIAAFAALVLAAGIGQSAAQAPNRIDNVSVSKASSETARASFSI